MKMLKAFAALALALCAAITFAADGDPPSVAGRLNYISGPVSFAPAQANEDWSAAVLNRPITSGDRLWTDANGRAEMHVGSLAVRMDSRTSLDVLNLDDRTFQLRLAQGSVNLGVRRLTGDKLLEIATPGGAVVVRQPGTYRISVDPSGAATAVAVRGGQAEVFTGNSSFLVRDNQQATLSGTRQDLFAAPPPDDFDRWAAARDQRKDRVASTRYVPEEMTGYEDLDEHGTWQTVPTYGAVWTPRAVPVGWAPYRAGHWVWVSPWGWTWVDDAPWGFAPFHYGRWVWLGNHWAWAPGRVVARPVYAPALVAFVGGPNWSLSIGAGSAPVVGWVPLGWHEPYRPWYRHSHAHMRDVNVTHVTNVTNITNVTNVRLVNRSAPSGVTVVSRENFVAAKPVQQATVKVSAKTAAAAPVTQGAPVATPARTSLAAGQHGSPPPPEARRRETVAVSAPPAPRRAAIREPKRNAREARRDGDDDRPRVRVIDRQQRVELQASQAQARRGAPAPQAATVDPAPEKSSPRAAPKAPPPQDERSARADRKEQPQSPSRAQGKASPAEARSERSQDKAAPQAQAAPQAERRAPAPPAEASTRPTFDREMRQVAPQPQADPKRQAERQERREQASRDAPAAPSAPQPDARSTPRAPEQRAQPAEQPRQQQVREQQAREQREETQQRAEQQRAQQLQQQKQAQERQAREQQARQRESQQQAERQRTQQQELQRQQQAQTQARQAREQQARQQEMQQQRRQQKQQEQRQRENAEKSAPQASAAERRPQQRAEQTHEKGNNRERQRGPAPEKG